MFEVMWDILWQLYCKFPGECDSDRILKIGQHLTKLCRLHWLTFLAHPVILLPTPGGIVIGSVCSLVGWFVRSLRSSWFLRSIIPSFMKSGADVQHLRLMSLLTSGRSGSKFKIKTVVLKNCNSSAVVKISSQNLAMWSDRSYFDMEYDFQTKFKIADLRRFRLSECFFSYYNVNVKERSQSK